LITDVLLGYVLPWLPVGPMLRSAATARAFQSASQATLHTLRNLGETSIYYTCLFDHVRVAACRPRSVV
jgi:hypothetical protein